MCKWLWGKVHKNKAEVTKLVDKVKLKAKSTKLEINKIEIRKTIHKINKTKLVVWKDNKTISVSLTNQGKKREDTKYKNEKWKKTSS